MRDPVDSLTATAAESPPTPSTPPSARRWRVSVAQLARRIRAESLLRNSGFMLATTVATSGLGYLYWILAARRYEVDAVGLGAALLSAASMVSLVSTLGIHFGVIHLLPRRTDDRDWSLTVNTALLVTTGAGLALGIASLAVILPLSGELRGVAGNWGFAVLFVGQAALGTTASTLDYVSVAQRASHGMFVRNVAASGLRIGLLVTPVLAHLGARGILASWFVGNIVIISGSLLVLRVWRPGYRFVLRGWRGEVRSMVPSLWHHAINLGNMTPALLLPVIAASRLSAADAAYLYTAWKVGGIFFMVSPAVASSLFAEGSHVSAGIERKIRLSALATASLVLPLMAFFLVAGRPVLGLFGEEYAAGGYVVLVLLILSAVPDAITNIYVSVLRIQGRLRVAAALNCGMAVLALTLGWLLLAQLGIAGAAAGWLAAQLVGSAVVLLDIQHRRSHRAAVLPRAASRPPVAGTAERNQEG